MRPGGGSGLYCERRQETSTGAPGISRHPDSLPVGFSASAGHLKQSAKAAQTNQFNADLAVAKANLAKLYARWEELEAIRVAAENASA